MKIINEQSKEMIIKALENQLVHWKSVEKDGGALQTVASIKIGLYELILNNVKNNIFDEATIDYISRSLRDLKKEEYKQVLKELRKINFTISP